MWIPVYVWRITNILTMFPCIKGLGLVLKALTAWSCSLFFGIFIPLFITKWKAKYLFRVSITYGTVVLWELRVKLPMQPKKLSVKYVEICPFPKGLIRCMCLLILTKLSFVIVQLIICVDNYIKSDENGVKGGIYRYHVTHRRRILASRIKKWVS